MSMKPVCYNIPEELDQRIRDLAEEEGRSLSAMATRLLEKALGAKSKKSLARPKASEEDHRLARCILASVQIIKPDYMCRNISAWAEDCRKMREIDGRDHGRIWKVFKWANHDTFWQTNILSPAKLRKQFDQLELKANQVKSHENAPGNPASRLELAKQQARQIEQSFRSPDPLDQRNVGQNAPDIRGQVAAQRGIGSDANRPIHGELLPLGTQDQ